MKMIRQVANEPLPDLLMFLALWFQQSSHAMENNIYPS